MMHTYILFSSLFFLFLGFLRFVHKCKVHFRENVIFFELFRANEWTKGSLLVLLIDLHIIVQVINVGMLLNVFKPICLSLDLNVVLCHDIFEILKLYILIIKNKCIREHSNHISLLLLLLLLIIYFFRQCIRIW